MRENYTLTRLFIDADLSAGAEVPLDKAQAHYLGTVLRKSVDDRLRIFNGIEGEWSAVIESVSKKGGRLRVDTALRAHHAAPDIWLLFAPIRKHRTAFILEKATELGVGTLMPVITARTQFPKLNLEKARAQIIEAAEQTERLDIPVLMKPQKLDGLLDGWDASRRIIFADEAFGGEVMCGEVMGGDAAVDAITTLKGLSEPCAILIGPEGGFDDRERGRLRAMDCVTSVSLGPRILRADTAALSLLTLWQAVKGDW